MVAIVSGNSLGLNLSSLAVLGASGRFGAAGQGRGTDSAYVNVANGNLILQSRDDLLVGRGLDVDSIRTYNSQGQLTDDNADNWLVGAFGQRIELNGAIGADGSTLTRTDWDGSRSVYAWDSARGLYVSTQGAGAFDTIAHDAVAAEFVWTDGDSGRSERYQDANPGKLVSVTDASGNAVTLAYNANGTVQSITDANGEVTYYDYAGTNLTQIRTVTAGNVTTTRVRYAYDSANRLSSVTVDLSPEDNDIADNKSYVTSYTYDGSSKRVASITQTDGSSLSFTYVLAGGDYKVETVTDAMGGVTHFSYDTTQGTTTVIDPLGATIVYAYDAQGQLTNVMQGVSALHPSGLSQVSYIYDDAGNVVRVTDGERHSVGFEYDSQGNLILESDSAGNTRVRTYNSANQLLTDTRYAKAGADTVAGLPETTRYVYAQGNPLQLRFVVSAQGTVTEYRYDAHGLRTSSISYSGSILSTDTLPTEAEMQSWRATQDLTQSQRTDYTYDARGALSGTTTFALIGTDGEGVGGTALATHYVYDQQGLLIQKIDAVPGAQTTYVYDGMGRLLAAEGPSLDGSTRNLSVTSYDDVGGKTTVTSTNGLSTISAYDHNGRLVSVSQRGPNAEALGETTYAYDRDGNLLMTQDPTGARHWSLYDEIGRKIADIDATGAFTEYTYNGNGLLRKTIAYATPVDTTSLIDGAGLPRTAWSSNGSTLGLQDLRPAETAQDQKAWRFYDVANRLIWQVDAQGYATQTTYDGASRVIAVTRLANPIDIAALDLDGDTSVSVDPTTVGGMTLVVDAAPVPLGSSITLEAVIDGTGASGMVTFFSGETILGSAQVVDGRAVLQTRALPVGVSNIRAAYSGDNERPAGISTVFQKTVVGATTGVVLALPAAATSYGAPFVLYASVNTLLQGLPAASGDVVFYDGDDVIGTASIANGVAALEIASLPPGTHSFRAEYAGDATHALGVSAASSLVIQPRPTSVDFSIAGNGVGSGLYATVVPAFGDTAPAPTGTVSFYSGTLKLGSSQLEYGQASIPLNINANSVPFTVVYEGDAFNAASTVTKPVRPTVQLLTDVSGGWTSEGTNIHLIAGVQGTTGAGGFVTFFDGDTPLGTAAVVNGSADIHVNFLTSGEHLIHVGYSGDANNSPASGMSQYITILSSGAALPPSNTTIGSHAVQLGVAMPNYGRYGLPTVIQAMANSSDSAQHPLTGTYSVFDGGQLLGSYPLDSSDGSWMDLPVSGLSQGPHLIRVVYSGDEYNSWASADIWAHVTLAPTEVQLTASTQQAIPGVPVLLTARVGHELPANYQGTSTASAPTGTVNFYNQGVLLGSATVVNGLATFSVSDLPPGDIQITAVYFGDWFNASNGSDSLPLNASKPKEYLELHAGSASAVYGTPVSLEVTTRATDGIPEGATIDIYDGDTLLGHATVSEGRATLQTTFSTSGTHEIRAVYLGGPDSAAATKSVEIAVGPAPASITNLTPASVSRNGDLSAQIAGIDAGGFVSFFEGTRLLGTVEIVNGLATLSGARLSAGAHEITIAYSGDALNASSELRVSQIIVGMPIVDSAQDRTTLQFFDKDGRAQASIDGEGYLTEYLYDGAGRLVETIRYAGKVPDFNGAQSIAQVAAAARTTHSLRGLRPEASANDLHTYNLYNARGQQVGQIDAEGYLTETEYDANGNVATTTRYANPAITTAGRASLSAVRPTFSAEDQIVYQVWDAANQLIERTNAEGTTTFFSYDSVGRLVSSTTSLGASSRTLTQRHDIQGRLIGELSGVGSALLDGAQTQADVDAIWAEYGITHTYDAAGRRTSTTAPGNQTTLFFYDSADRLTHTVNALGEVTETRYNALGQVSAEVRYGSRLNLASVASHPGGLLNPVLGVLFDDLRSSTDSVLTHSYNATGTLAATTDALNHTVSYAYNAFREAVASQQTIQGQVVQNSSEFDRRGQLIATTLDAQGVAATADRIYDAFGRLVQSIDANGNNSSFDYDRLGRVITATDPSGAANSSTYDAFDRVLTRTDALGNTTSYSYDTAARSMTVTTPSGFTTTTTHDALGHTQSLLDGNGNITTYAYDLDGQLLSTTVGMITYSYDAQGNKVTTTTPLVISEATYDTNGRLSTSVDANGNVIVYSYDKANRLLSRAVDPDGLNLTTTYQYDAKGQRLSEIDARGIVTQTSYDLAGQVITQVVDAGGLNLTTTFSYDAAGRTLTTTSPGGTETRYTYDGLGRRTTTQVDPDGLSLTTNYVYDAKGNLIVRVDPNGNATRYAYDENDRLVFIVDATGGVQRTLYDDNGRISRTTSFAQRIDLSLLGDTLSVAEITAQLQPSASQDVDQFRLYNADGQLSYTVNGTGDVATFEYDGNGNLVHSLRYANRIDLDVWEPGTQPDVTADSALDKKVETTYDSLNRAVILRTSVDDGTRMAVVRQQFDGNGNLTSRTAYAQTITHDRPISEFELSALIEGPGSPQDMVTRSIYDAAGRRTWTTNGMGDVTQFVHDANGNVVKQIRYANRLDLGAVPNRSPDTVVASGADRITLFAYDGANRMGYTVDAMGGVSHSIFDANGNAVQQIAYVNRVAAPTASTVVPDAAALQFLITTNAADRVSRLVYDSANRAAYAIDTGGGVTHNTYDAAGNLVARTAYANTIDASVLTATAGIAAVQALLSSSAANDRTTLSAFDAAGRAVYTIDALGYVTGTEYDGIGHVTVTSHYSQALTNLEPGVDATTLYARLASNDGQQIRHESFSYDAAGNLVSASDRLGYSESYAYDGLGNKVSFTNKLGNTWYYDYDAAGRLSMEYAPGGATSPSSWNSARVETRLEYDAFGNLTSRTEAYGRPEERTTEYSYDALGRQVLTRFPQVGVYNHNEPEWYGGIYGNSRSEDYTSLTSEVFYNSFGEAVASRDVSGNWSYKGYDAQGQLTYEVDAMRYVTSYQRNRFGETTALTRHAQVANIAFNPGVEIAPSASEIASGITPSVSDRTITTEYDRLGRAVRVTQPAVWVGVGNGQGYMASAVTQKTYDAFGQVILSAALADAPTNTWAVTTNYYDARGQLIATVDPMGFTTSNDYDAAGNLISVYEFANAGATGTPSSLTLPVNSDKDRLVTFAYDANNRKIRQTLVNVTHSVDSDGTAITGNLTTSYGYDGLGNLVRTTDATGGNTYTYYDAMGRVSAVAGPGRVNSIGKRITPLTEFKRDALGNVVAKYEYAAGAVSATEDAYYLRSGWYDTYFDWDTGTLYNEQGGWDAYGGWDGYGGRYTGYNALYDPGYAYDDNRANHVTTNEYDALGRLIRTQDASGALQEMSYDAAGHLAKSWQKVYNYESENPEQVIYAVFEYDALGRQISTFTPASNSVVGSEGIVVRSQDMVGSVRTQTLWNAFGDIIAKRSRSNMDDGSGYDERFEYDNAGRLWRTDSGDGVFKVMLYDLQGRQTSTIASGSAVSLWGNYSAQDVDALGSNGVRRTDSQLDLLGRVVAQTLPQRQDSIDPTAYRPIVYQTFDRWGNVLSKSDPRNAAWVTFFDYNHNNQVIEQRQPDANGSATGDVPITKIYYDAMGRQVAIRDANGHVNGQVWDAGGNMIEEHHADGGVVTQTFNTFGARTKVEDAEGNVTRYRYDRMSRNTAITYENVGIYTTDASLAWTGGLGTLWTTSQYDTAGRKIAQSDGTGATTRYEYDLRGNVIKTTDANGFVSRTAFDTYDHKIAGQDANLNMATWAYDPFGRVFSHTDIGGATYTYEYDQARQLISESNTRGRNISYAYDAAGQLVGIEDHALNQVSFYDYNAAGQRVREKMVQDGVTYQDQTIGYDTLGRQALIDAFNGVHVMTTFDKVGNKLQQHTTYTTQLGAGVKDLWYAYDEMNRQILVDGAVDGNAANEANITATQGHILAYDLNGNRTMDKTWGNRVVVQMTTLDESGAPLSTPVYAGAVLDQGVTTQWYDYDAMNRLSQVWIGSWAQYQTGIDESGSAPAPIYGPTTAFGNPKAIKLDERLYDGAGRVVHSGPTGSLPASYLAMLTAGNADLPGAVSVATQYDAGGRAIRQMVYNDANPMASYWTFYQQFLPGIPSMSDTPVGSGYDSAGNLQAYRVFRGIGAAQTSETHVILHDKFEGYVQTQTYQIDINASNPAPIGGVTTQAYDVNGHLTSVTDMTSPLNNRTFINDAQGQILQKLSAPAWQSNQLIVNGEVTGMYGMLPDTHFPKLPNGLINYTPTGNFNLDYQSVTNRYPNAAVGQYTVQSGDTLRAIALNAYGDSSLWYLIANANALEGDADLRVGQAINIPTKLGATNNASTFTPYDPSRIIGSTDPQLPAPAAASKKGKCGGIGKLLVAVVAAVATVFTAGAASLAFEGALGTTFASSGVGGIMGAGAAALGGGSITASLIGGAVGSIVSQGVAIAIGEQDKFSWSSVALGALGAGVSAGVGSLASSLGFGAGQLSGPASWLAAAGRTAISSAATQGIAVAVGLQDHFSWSSVAASAVGAGVGAAVAEGVNSAMNYNPRNFDFGKSLVSGTLSSIAAGATTAALRGGRASMTQVAVDAFGNALGQSIAESFGQTASSSSSTGEDQLGELIRRNNGWAGVPSQLTFAEDTMSRRAINNPYGLPTSSPTQLISDQGWTPTNSYSYAGISDGITNWRNNPAASSQAAEPASNGPVVRDWDPDNVQESAVEPGQLNRNLSQAIPFSKINGVTYYKDANGVITDYDPTPKYVRNPVAGSNRAEVEQRAMNEAARDGAQQLAQEAQDASDRAAFEKRTSIGGAMRGLGSFVEGTVKSPYHLYRSVDEVGITGTAERMAEGFIQEPSRMIEAASSGDMQTLTESAAGMLLGVKGLRGSNVGRESLSVLERTDQRLSIKLTEEAGNKRVGNASGRLEEGTSAERAAAAAADIPLGLRGSGTTLAANMGGLEQGFQAHHLVMSSMGKDSLALKYLAEKGLYDINRASNGIALPSSEFLALADELPMHLGSHGKIYKEAVSAELNALDIAYRRGVSDASLMKRIGIIENNLADRLLKGEIWLNGRDAALRKLGPYK